MILQLLLASSSYVRRLLLQLQAPMNAASNTSIVIAIGLPAGPPLPVMGLPGIRVIIQSAMNTIVPPIPIAYHGIPHLLTMGIIQNT